MFHRVLVFFTVSPKKLTPFTCFNCVIHELILMTFCKNIFDYISNQKMLYFFTSAVSLYGKKETQKLFIFLDIVYIEFNTV